MPNPPPSRFPTATETLRSVAEDNPYGLGGFSPGPPGELPTINSDLVRAATADQQPQSKNIIGGGQVSYQSQDDKNLTKESDALIAAARAGRAQQASGGVGANIEAIRQDIMSMPATGTTVQRVLPNADPTLVAGITTQLNQQRVDSAKQAQEAVSSLQSIQHKSAAVVGDAIERQNQLIARLANRAPGLKSELETANKNYEKARDFVLKSNFDPNRLVESMPRWAQVMTVISTSFDSLANAMGVGTGQPQVSTLINAAILRDQQDQLRALDVRMKQLGIAEDQRRFAIKRMDAFQKQQMQAAQALTQMRLAGLASESNSVKTIFDVSRTANQMASQISLAQVKISQAGREQKSITTTPSGKDKLLAQLGLAAAKASAKGQAGDPVLFRQETKILRDAGAARRTLVDLTQEIARVRKRYGKDIIGGGLASLVRRIGAGEAAALGNQIGALALSAARARQGGGKVSDQDQKLLQRVFPRFWQTDRGQRLQLKLLFNDSTNTLLAASEAAIKQGRYDIGEQLAVEARSMRIATKMMQQLFPTD